MLDLNFDLGLDLWSNIPVFDDSYKLDEKGYNDLTDFILERFKDFNFSLCGNSSRFLQSINLNTDLEYCCFSVYKNCFRISRIEIPEDKRGLGFLKTFLVELYKFLPSIGINCILFENILNKDLLDYLVEEGYEKIYLNVPKSNCSDTDICDVYKIIGGSLNG